MKTSLKLGPSVLELLGVLMRSRVTVLNTLSGV